MKRSPAQRFEDLIVWQKAHSFVLGVYKYTKSFPKHEMFGLSSHLRRAAVSIAANIAEGFRKRGPADKVRYMNISEGSSDESLYYLILSRDLKYGDPSALMDSLTEVSKLLRSYSRAILDSKF